MSSTLPSASSPSVRNILALLVGRDAQLVAGASGLERSVTWASRMRARMPAFESIRGGELAILSLSQLGRLDQTLARLLTSLSEGGVAAVAVAAPADEALGSEACTLANHLQFPLILLPAAAALEEIEREVITFVVSFRGETERQASEISHQLMQLSTQGVDMQGLCDQLARSCNKWVIVEDATHAVRVQAAPPGSELLTIASRQSEQAYRQRNLTPITVPILMRHEAVGYLSLVGEEGDADYREHLILGQVAPILALQFARAKERSEVEGRYQVEAFMDVLQGAYQQPDEMLARASLLGHDLGTAQVVVILEISATEAFDAPDNDNSKAQWTRRLRDELLRLWPTCWPMSESRRVTALIPVAMLESAPGTSESVILTRLEGMCKRLQQSDPAALPAYASGIGRPAAQLESIPRSWREAQQALEIGRKLFGVNQAHSFTRLGVYRLLFYLGGEGELSAFYQEMLGPLLSADNRGDGVLLETLEGFFRCNGNLSETARAMNLHRNSLLYRLGRIADILGRSLDDAEYRLSLQVALKIHRMLLQRD